MKTTTTIVKEKKNIHENKVNIQVDILAEVNGLEEGLDPVKITKVSLIEMVALVTAVTIINLHATVGVLVTPINVDQDLYLLVPQLN